MVGRSDGRSDRRTDGRTDDYLSTMSRPDIAYYMSVLCSFMQNPSLQCYEAGLTAYLPMPTRSGVILAFTLSLMPHGPRPSQPVVTLSSCLVVQLHGVLESYTSSLTPVLWLSTVLPSDIGTKVPPRVPPNHFRRFHRHANRRRTFSEMP